MELTSDNLQKLLGFPFRGPDWKTRLGIGVLVALAGWVVPILPWLVLTGYAIQIARQVAIEGREPELPPWSDWATYLIDGFKVSLARFLMSLPIVLVMLFAYALFFGGTITGGLLSESGGRGAENVGALIAVLSSVTGVGLFMVAMPIILIVSLIVPVPTMHAAITGDLGAIFRVKEWWRLLRADIGAWAMSYLVLIGIGLIVNLVTSVAVATVLLCLVIPIFMMAYMTYAMLIGEVVFAQAYRRASLKLGLPPGGGAVIAPSAPTHKDIS